MAIIYSAYSATRLLLIVLGLGLLVIYNLVSIPYEAQAIFFISSVLIAGIPHGSLDHAIHLKSNKLEGKKISKWGFLSYYYRFLVLYGIVWLLDVDTAIIVFLLISSFHFGEIDWIWLKGKNRRLLLCISTIYGFMLLSNLFLFHYAEIRPIMSGFSGLSVFKLTVFEILYPVRWTYLIISSSLVFSSILVYQVINKHSWIKMFFALLQIVVLTLIVTQLPVFLGFGFYFSCWHSLLTFQSLKNYLLEKKDNWFTLIRLGFLNTFAATISIGVILMFCLDGIQMEKMVALSLIGIAVLTAPHMLVISQMLKFQFSTSKFQ